MHRNPAVRHLRALYALCDQFAAGRDKACHEGCSACCTRNVVMTTLEGRLILGYLHGRNQTALLARVARAASQPGFRPTVSINQMASMCADGRDIPEEEADPNAGPCPLLIDGKCPIYEVRPFGCRAMMSRQPCARGGAADMPALVLTMNTIFMQYIEALDAGNRSGNMVDVLLYLQETGSAPAGGPPRNERAGLLQNRPITVLMVPPEHRRAVMPLLNGIRQALQPDAAQPRSAL